MASVRSLQRVRDALWMGQDLAQVPPNQANVELVGGRVTGGTLLLQAGLGLLVLAGADVVPLPVFVVPAGLRARDAAQLAPSATHQRPQQVGMRFVVAFGKGLVLGELLFHKV